jgi:hypothetical protein
VACWSSSTSPASGVGVSLREEIAQAQQVACLAGFPIAQDGFEGRDGVPVVGLAVVGQPDVEPDTGHFRREPLSGAQFRQGRRPFTAAHVDYRQVAVGAHVVWLGCQNLTEVLFRGAEVAATECLLSLLEGCPGTVRFGRGPQRHKESQNQEAVAWQEAAFHRAHTPV